MAAQQKVELRLGPPASPTLILVDEGRMMQVLNNLIENALRYTPAGGVIELGAAADDQVQVWVKDTGYGIEAEDLPYVFDRFYRADKARGANAGKMGLGLAICKALVTAQGGQITAESSGKGQGATIIMAFAPAPVPED
jgi:signal transduction histidine kinase